MSTLPITIAKGPARHLLTPTDALLERLCNIPDDLVKPAQWVCWRQESDQRGLPTKRPYQARRPLRLAQTDNPATWATFSEAVEAFASMLDQPDRFTGIGFVFADAGPFTGVDFDDCRQGGAILRPVLEVIGRLGGYAEISPSVTGVKLWTHASIPVPAGRSGFQYKGLFGCSKVEVYRSRRFFAVTGWRLDQ